MKKILIIMMAILMIAPVYAESKDVDKARKKEYSQKLKEYKKGKWEILGSHTLDYALAKHFDRLHTLGDDAYEVEGISTATTSKNAGKQIASNNAAITYAQNAGSTLKGRIISDIFAGVNPGEEFDHFYAAYERLVEKEIKNELEPSYTIIHTNPDGSFEIRSYFIVVENQAAKARLRAVREALESSEAAQKYAEKISSFVSKGFNE